MAAVGRPMGRKHQDDVRSKIQASQLINVLQNHALGKAPDEIPQSRMKAIEILLKKSLPDLSSVENTLSGPDGGPVNHSINVTFGKR